MAGQVEQRVDLGDGHRLRAVGDLDDLLAGLDLTLGEHPAGRSRADGETTSRAAMLGSSIRMPTR